jgi:molybdate transport system substrate-binding protein
VGEIAKGDLAHPTIPAPAQEDDDMTSRTAALHRIGFIATLGALAVSLLALALPRPATAAELRVFTTGAPAVAVRALAATFTAESGMTFTFTVGQPATIAQKLAAGEPADIVIAPAPLIAALEQTGTLRAGNSTALARVGIGVVVREGAPRPDISTPAAIRRLLIDARSIAWPDPATGGGFTGKWIARMVERMGIADAIKPKVTLAHAITGGVDLVADNKVEVGLFNISEILPIKGVTLVGPLPAELQSYIVFTAGIPAGSAGADSAAAFIKMMASAAARAAWIAAGMEPVGGGL